MSGAGKTTLINLLSGFLPLKNGNFEIQGKETTDLNEDAWRNQIIYIPQSPYIFDNTLRYNIAFYTPDASDEEIIEANAALNILGGKAEYVDKFVLPGTDMGRALVKVKKVKSTPGKYPRKAGLPAKEPLK